MPEHDPQRLANMASKIMCILSNFVVFVVKIPRPF